MTIACASRRGPREACYEPCVCMCARSAAYSRFALLPMQGTWDVMSDGSIKRLNAVSHRCRSTVQRNVPPWGLFNDYFPIPIPIPLPLRLPILHRIPVLHRGWLWVAYPFQFLCYVPIWLNIVFSFTFWYYHPMQLSFSWPFKGQLWPLLNAAGSAHFWSLTSSSTI